MKLNISKISDLKILNVTTNIGISTNVLGNYFGLNDAFTKNEVNKKEITNLNLYIYNFFITELKGATHFLMEEIPNKHYFIKLLEILFDNFNDKKKVIQDFNIIIKDYKKSEYLLDIYNENGINILINKGNKSKYYSLLYLAIPFGLKINNKKDLINDIKNFISNFTTDDKHILTIITIGLFINYAQNDVNINGWIPILIEDIQNEKDSEKYIDYLKNYYEINFRKGLFEHSLKESLINERNKSFFSNYCSPSNRLLTENPEEQVLLIYDTLIRAQDNWEQLILFGMSNFNENIIISLVLGLLYEILFSSKKINKNLIKRFSF
jgi:hypothetical protein